MKNNHQNLDFLGKFQDLAVKGRQHLKLKCEIQFYVDHENLMEKY